MDVKEHKKRALFVQRDLSSVPLSDAVSKMIAYRETASAVFPDFSALSFYFMNHLFGKAELAGMDDNDGEVGAFVDAYFDEVNDLAARMFYYMLLICTRESRHAKSPKTMEKECGKEFYNFWYDKLNGTGSNGAVSNLQSNPPKMTLGDYTKSLLWSFRKLSYSSGYGGDAWAGVAQILDDFVHGRISGLVMLDCAFNSAHNNGPIFNKGMLFGSYSANFIEVLDVQRAGEIPNLIDTLRHFPAGGPLSQMVYNDFNYLDKYLGNGNLSTAYSFWAGYENQLGMMTGMPVNWVSVMRYGVHSSSHKSRAREYLKNVGIPEDLKQYVYDSFKPSDYESSSVVSGSGEVTGESEQFVIYPIGKYSIAKVRETKQEA